MSGGGKGGKSKSEVKIPAWLEAGAKNNMARANELAQIGYVPYYGPDVAAFSPMQQAAMQNTNDAAAAFGMAAPSNAMAGMPQAMTFADGTTGYSSAPLYQQSLDALAAQRPGQFAALNAPFINPVTGADPASPFDGGSGQSQQQTSLPNTVNAMKGGSGRGRDGDRGGYQPARSGGGTGSFGLPDPMSGRISSIGPIGRDGIGGMGRGK